MKFNLYLKHEAVNLRNIRTGKGGLLLCSHTDTVPFDEGRWTQDPFTLTEKENSYMLGTADMKGFFSPYSRCIADVDTKTLTHPLYSPPLMKKLLAGARYFAAIRQSVPILPLANPHR